MESIINGFDLAFSRRRREMYIGVDELKQTIFNNHVNQKLRYWFDIKFGYILRNVESSELTNFYPSANTSFFNGEIPMINNDIHVVIDQIEQDAILERLKRPNSKYSIERIYEYVIEIIPIPDIPIGALISLPLFIKNSKSIISFENVPNNLCFWYCLAHHKYPLQRLDRLSSTVKKLFDEYYKKSFKNYQGVDEDELDSIENHFSVKINIYRTTEKKAIMVKHSPSQYNNILNLNLYTEKQINHFSYIKNINKLSKTFQCPDCNIFLREAKKMPKHMLTCSKGKPKIFFEAGNYNPPLSIFEQLEENGVLVERELRFYPYYIFYDFETYLKPNECNSSSKLQYLGTHELLSISLIGSEEEKSEFIPVRNTTTETLNTMINKMNEIRKKYLHMLYPKYCVYFKEIAKIDDEKIRKMLRKGLLNWLDEMPVYGFNSSSYDLNVIKKYLPQVLAKHSKKQGNISKSEKLWIRSIEEELGRNLEQNKKIGRYNVDGYDNETKTVYEFNGCLFHGCPKCYNPNDINPLTGDKMNVLYEKTIKKESNLKQMGYKVKSIWNCEFQAPKDIELNDIIKCNNKYRMISNGSFSFKDIQAYLAPGTSLDKFLKAFDTELTKAVFPHKITQNIKKYVKQYPNLSPYTDNVIELLKNSSIPTKKWFNNDLKSESISQELYHQICANFTNLYDLLEHYNNCDVKPSVEATKKLADFFKTLNLDIHKDEISISGLTLKYLWMMKEENCEFQLFKGNEELYHKFKDNLVGGPSIIFHHYHEQNKTRMREGNLCQKIVGYDANALYLYDIGQDMLCGNHQVIEPYDNILTDIKHDSFFGLVECDVEVPTNLRAYFAEMPPIFKNVEITYEDVSDETKIQLKTNYKSKKLIGSFFGKKMLFHTNLLKWYLEKGLVVSNITYAVRYQRKKPFKTFMEQVADERRAGDTNPNYKLRGDMMKLIGNSSYGKCITNFLKHEKVKIVSSDKYSKNIRMNGYKSHEDLYEGFEFRFKKMSFKQNLPIQVGFAVYQLAKLRMLEFYYDFIDFYIDRSDFQYCLMDTDSAYLAISGDSLDDIVKPELKEAFQQNKHLWLGKDDTPENELYDKRTPGLFKLEYEGDGIIALASKMYYCFGDTDKFSSKGIKKKQNEITKQKYLDALKGNSSQEFINKGFRVRNNEMNTYTLTKNGLKLFNDKRLRVGFKTLPPKI